MTPLARMSKSQQPAECRAVWLRRAVAFSGLCLVAATWPLWTPLPLFPQVPLIAGQWLPGDWAQWLTMALLILALVAMLVLPGGRSARLACATVAACFAMAMLFDQGRMQPWAYQFIILSVLLASCSAHSALMLARLLVIAFYLQSAITKLDHSFLHTLGQQFLATLVQMGGGTIEGWSESMRLAAAMFFPVGELLVALGLIWPRTRSMALGAAVFLHLMLLAILGPWGLAHQPGVLLWNAYFIVQDLVLFWPGSLSPAEPEPGAGTSRSAPWPVLAMVLAAALLPLTEPWGLFDLWPSWGLYASSAERLSLQVHRVARSQLPEELQPFIETPADEHDPWLTVRLDRWALATRHAPIYPQARVQLGVALSVAEGAALAERARFIRFGRSDRWTGERDTVIYEGVPAARTAAERYLLNALPRRPFRATGTP